MSLGAELSSGVQTLRYTYLLRTRIVDVTRLTKAELVQHRLPLEIWQAPAVMLEYCDRLMDHMESADLFTQGGAHFILEGWAAAKFALVRGAQEVRLVSERESWPDFQLRLNSEVGDWELTEADQPGRRRGDEYREADQRVRAGGSRTRQDRVENWVQRAEQAPGAIRERCIAKAAKNYAGSASLLVYLILSEYGIRQKEVEESLPEATAPAKDAFTEVWVLWKDRAYAIWRNGSRIGEPRDQSEGATSGATGGG